MTSGSITTPHQNTIEFIDGGEWKLVRHVPAGNVWHRANDLLVGRDVYGIPSGSNGNNEWSIRFDNISFSQFLFATGDGAKWLIASKNEVTGAFYSNKPRLVEKSSIHPTRAHRVKWYRRTTNLEDPWISLTDHSEASTQGNILYGGNSFTDHTKVLPIHNGANVFIR